MQIVPKKKGKEFSKMGSFKKNFNLDLQIKIKIEKRVDLKRTMWTPWEGWSKMMIMFKLVLEIKLIVQQTNPEGQAKNRDLIS